MRIERKKKKKRKEFHWTHLKVKLCKWGILCTFRLACAGIGIASVFGWGKFQYNTASLCSKSPVFCKVMTGGFIEKVTLILFYFFQNQKAFKWRKLLEKKRKKKKTQKHLHCKQNKLAQQYLNRGDNLKAVLTWFAKERHNLANAYR